MQWTELFSSPGMDTWIAVHRLFVIPVALSLAAWWAWASLLPRPRRRRDWLALLVPVLFLLIQIPLGLRFSWMITHGFLAGVILAGLLLMFAARRVRQLSRPARLAVISSAALSLIVLLAMLSLLWKTWGWTTLFSIYAGVLLFSTALTWVVGKLAGVRRPWPAPVLTSAFVAAFLVATFIFPVGFFYLGLGFAPSDSALHHEARLASAGLLGMAAAAVLAAFWQGLRRRGGTPAR